VTGIETWRTKHPLNCSTDLSMSFFHVSKHGYLENLSKEEKDRCTNGNLSALHPPAAVFQSLNTF